MGADRDGFWFAQLPSEAVLLHWIYDLSQEWVSISMIGDDAFRVYVGVIIRAPNQCRRSCYAAPLFGR